MRIDPPKRQQVQSLGRHSVGNTGLEGDIAKIAATTAVVAGLATQAAGILTERDRQKADIQMQNSDAAFHEKYSGKDFINVNELPGHIAKDYQEDDKVAAARVMPQLYKDHVKTSLDSSSKNIKVPGVRNRWLAEKNTVASSRINKIQIASTAAIEKQVTADQASDADEQAALGNYEMAKEIVKSMRVEDNVKQDAYLKINKTQEGAIYKNHISEYKGDLTLLQADSAFLGQEYDEYKENGGMLSPAERKAAKIEVDGWINTFSKTNEKLPQRIKAQLDHDIALALKNPVDGLKSDYGTITELFKRTMDANGLKDENYESELIKLTELANLGQIVDQMIVEDRLSRKQFIDSNPTIEGYSDAQNRNFQNQITAAHVAKTDAENTDLMSSADDAGIFGEKGLVPIDFNADPATLYAQISTRKEQYTKAKAQYGEGLGTGILRKQEAAALSQAFEKMSTQQQSNMLISVGNALGLEAGSDFFQQLASDGESSTLTNAGVAMINGFANYSDTMLNGMKYRKNNPKEMKDFNANHQDMMFTTIGNMFVNKPVKRGTMKNSITDAYVGIATGRGETLEIFDEDIYEEAVRMATGGLFEQGKYKLSNPEFGMADGAMEEWIETTNYLILDDQNQGGIARRDLNSGVQLMESSKETWQRIKDDDYQLQGSDQTDEWIVVDQNGTPFKNKAGETYRIKYDSTASKGNFGLNKAGQIPAGPQLKGRFGVPSEQNWDFPVTAPWNREFTDPGVTDKGRG